MIWLIPSPQSHLGCVDSQPNVDLFQFGIAAHGWEYFPVFSSFPPLTSIYQSRYESSSALIALLRTLYPGYSKFPVMSFVGSVAAFADIPRTDTNDMSIATISGMENFDSPLLIGSPPRIPLFLLRGWGGGIHRFGTAFLYSSCIAHQFYLVESRCSYIPCAGRISPFRPLKKYRSALFELPILPTDDSAYLAISENSIA